LKWTNILMKILCQRLEKREKYYNETFKTDKG